jgi:hypothetical protein
MVGPFVRALFTTHRYHARHGASEESFGWSKLGAGRLRGKELKLGRSDAERAGLTR